MKINIPEPDPKYFTKEEFEKMIAYCDNEVLKDAFTWAVFTGVREAELIKAKPSDVNVYKRIMKVYSTVSNPNKDKDSREIEMHKRLIPIFEKYKSQEFIFLNPNTNMQFTARALLDGVTKACKKAGLKHFTFKDLRSIYATWLINADAPLKWISQQMGHSSLSITEKHYAKYITKEFRGEIDKLNF
ncbi:MAG: site-specific integrase [Bacteroidetes bacterium]|nr:site-specific integrase [Bacteroidota bacterium]